MGEGGGEGAHFETLAIHAGIEPDPSTGAIMTPIFQTSTYVQQAPGKHKGFDYSRTSNPTRKVLEENLAALEGGRYGLAFSSGVAATTTVAQTLPKGSHILCADDVYGGTYRVFERVFKPLGMTVTYSDFSSEVKIRKALRPQTRMVWLETPTNPLLKLIDLEMVTYALKGKPILKAADNTFATPYFQRPLSLGMDVVVHSTTKYLNGHSDVVGGAAVTNHPDLYDRLKFFQNAVGAVPGPFDCFLVLRGIKTLAVRMRQHEISAKAVAEFLSKHLRVKRVMYPGLWNHPQHDLAVRQMSGFGGMVSFEMAGGRSAALKFLKRVKIFSLAESLGGVESLIEHPAIMTHASIPKVHREARGITDGLIRVSVGIEHIDDLLRDLDQALR